jgi:GTPase
MLFATLDPTLRALALPRGNEVILSDTVGFISDLPTMLVAAFKATLEEVIEADLILHVRDIAHIDSEAQREDVERVLAGLGIEDLPGRVLEVWNKIDLLDAEKRMALRNAARRLPTERRPTAISALSGEGIAELLTRLETRLGAGRVVFDLHLDPGDGRGRNWLYEHTEVLRRGEGADGSLNLTVSAPPALAEKVRQRFTEAAAAPRRQRRH